MQLIKLNTLFDKFETFLKSSLKLAGLLMRFVIIISIIMMTSCAHEDITIETIRDETAVAETDTSAGNKNSETDVTPTAEESVNKASSSEVSCPLSDIRPTVYITTEKRELREFRSIPLRRC